MEMMRESVRIMMLLLERELFVMLKSWRATLFSAAMFSVLLACAARFFLPLMGMSEVFVIPLFLGSFIVSCLSIGYSCCLEIAYDLRAPQLIRYYSMLPAHFGFIIAAQVLAIMMRIIVLAIPVLMGGLCIINQWHMLNISGGAVLAIISFAALFNALFFLILAYSCTIQILLGNVWPRFLSPLFAFGCALYPWRTVASHSPIFSLFLLCNPMTYCVEGLRSACLGGEHFISVPHCLGFLMGVVSILSGVLWAVSIRAVNPVRMRKAMI
jgi:hypothetical protein